MLIIPTDGNRMIEVPTDGNGMLAVPADGNAMRPSADGSVTMCVFCRSRGQSSTDVPS